MKLIRLQRLGSQRVRKFELRLGPIWSYLYRASLLSRQRRDIFAFKRDTHAQQNVEVEFSTVLTVCYGIYLATKTGTYSNMTMSNVDVRGLEMLFVTPTSVWMSLRSRLSLTCRTQD